MKNDKKELKGKELFSNIIGYDEIKSTLRIIVDTLNNEEKYRKLGSTIAHGLLLYGPPGTGKTSMAYEIINNVDRKKYIIRKTKSDGEFLDFMNKTFEEAKKNQPAIILLDDMDKFGKEDKKNSEEFVAIQSLIDDSKNDNIFIIATVNEILALPSSLQRAGRFDIQLHIKNPKEKDLFKIFKQKKKKKKIAKEVDINKIVSILSGSSCAELEKVCNQAGIYAGYKNSKEISLEDLLRSALELTYETNIENINLPNKYALNTAYHEAGHALIGELLEPDSISFISVCKNDGNTCGFTIFQKNEDYWLDIKFMQNRIKTLLAGKAATEIVFNTCDTGVESDMRRSYEIARRFVDDFCMLDFDSWFFESDETSEKVKQKKDENTSKIIKEYYEEVKEVLKQNRLLLDKLAHELKEKKILFKDEIKAIIDSNKKD